MLHRCPPLSAWLTVHACTTNQRVESSGRSSKLGEGLHLRAKALVCCAACPGIVALAAGTKELPEGLRLVVRI